MNDTHPQAERIWLKLLKEAGASHRGRIASHLTNASRWRTREAIARAHPTWSQVERDVFFVEAIYGSKMAGRVRAALEARVRW